MFADFNGRAEYFDIPGLRDGAARPQAIELRAQKIPGIGLLKFEMGFF